MQICTFSYLLICLTLYFLKTVLFLSFFLFILFYFVFAVNEGGIKQASNLCPDPGEPENGKRIGSDFR